MECDPESSHTCKKSSRRAPCPTGQNFITVLFLMSKVLHCLQSKNQENEIFWPRSSSGWVLAYVRTFRMTFQTFFNFVIWSWTTFLTVYNPETRKMKFWGRGVLLDEFLHMSELSTFHFLQLLIWSYGLITDSLRWLSSYAYFSLWRWYFR